MTNPHLVYFKDANLTVNLNAIAAIEHDILTPVGNTYTRILLIGGAELGLRTDDDLTRLNAALAQNTPQVRAK